MICNHTAKWGTLINIFKPFLLFYFKKSLFLENFEHMQRQAEQFPSLSLQNHQPMASSASSSSLPTSTLF